MFSFGFGKKAEAEPEIEDTSAEEARLAEIQAAELKAQMEAEALAKAEKDAKVQAAKQAKQDAEVKRRADAEAKVLAKQKAAEEKALAKEVAAQKKAADKLAKAEADAQAKRIADEQAAKEAAALAEQQEIERLAEIKAEEEQTAREEAERIAVLEAEEAERIATEKAEELARQEAERQESERLVAEEQAASESAAQVDVPADPESEEDDERRDGWFKRLRKGLSRSSNNLTESITSVFTKKKLDEDTLQDLEDILIQADLGVETAMNITDTLASQRMGKDVSDEEVRQIMADEIAKVLEPVAQPLELDLEHQPHVILVVGVNGSGKTTTIGKISQKLYEAGFSNLLVAGDTFRAAAIEQLHIWGERTQSPVMSRENGADAAGLAFDAYSEAKALNKDVMLMDTAGRLQNKKELMDELEKIIRVLKKQDPTAPHTVLLTLDATTGQNALNQVEIFKDVAGVNGLVMTKLDGTARGGILVAISAKHKLPVYFIGVGEQVEDLEPFEANVFANTIAGLDNDT